MDPTAVLALYDRFERREAEPVGRRVERTAHVVRQVGPPGRPSWVAWSDLTGKDVDAVIAAEVAYWTALGQPTEWTVFGHDRPADLRERLAAAGFVIEAPEAVMAFDLRDEPPWLEAEAGHDVREHGVEGVDAVAAVMTAVWPEFVDEFVARFGEEAAAAPERTRFFVAYEDGAPVAAGWAQASGPATPFLGLWGGAVKPACRGRGLYRALVAARARHALARETRYLTVDAGPMSRPILERLGFVQLTTATPCNWRMARSEP